MSEETLISKVKTLAKFCLNDRSRQQLCETLDDPKKNLFMLSNEVVCVWHQNKDYVGGAIC